MRPSPAKIQQVCISALLICTSAVFLYTAGFGTFSAMTQRALLMALLSPVAFFSLKKGDDTRGESIFNILLAVMIMAVNIYVMVVWEDRVFKSGEILTSDVVVGTILVILILIATQKTNGTSLTVTAGLFLVYALLGPYFPSFLAHRGESWSRLVNFLMMSTDGIYGIPMDVASTYIIVFIVFGAFMEALGGGQWFVEVAYSLAGRFRGGPAKAAIFGSACMGAITGSPPASVATIGTFTIPLMKKVGYPPTVAGAIEAVASTGGLFTPPVMGAGAFIMAQYLNMPYWNVCIAAIVPAVLYYLSLMFVADARAVKGNLVGLPREELPSFWKAMKARGHLGIPVLFLVVSIASGFSPMRAAFWSIVIMIAVSFFSRLTRPTPAKILSALEAGAKQAIQIVITCAAAGIIVGVFLITGLGAKLTYTLIAFAQGDLFWAAFWSMVIANILGLPLPATAVYLILVTILVPVLTKVGAVPIAAHLFIWIYASIGAITPPVAIAAYCAAAIAQTNPDKTGWLAFRFGIPAFIIPFMFIWNPAVILQGTPIDIIIAVTAEVIGVMCLVGAMEGYLFAYLGIAARCIIGVAAGFMMYPKPATQLIGVAVIGAAYLSNLAFKPKPPAPKPPVGGAEKGGGAPAH
jgi:TRAP transporter 4TM/12TM fusion protein